MSDKVIKLVHESGGTPVVVHPTQVENMKASGWIEYVESKQDSGKKTSKGDE